MGRAGHVLLEITVGNRKGDWRRRFTYELKPHIVNQVGIVSIRIVGYLEPDHVPPGCRRETATGPRPRRWTRKQRAYLRRRRQVVARPHPDSHGIIVAIGLVSAYRGDATEFVGPVDRQVDERIGRCV